MANTTESGQHDPADELETPLEHLGDVGSAVQDFSHEEQGYHKALKPRQLQMIAIGGAIGTGLFLGAGGRLQQTGPVLIFTYALCGFFAFLVLRALGELVLHRPSSGSFVSYAREFFGEKMAYIAGWMYFLNWSTTAIGDATAIALYVQYWSLFTSVPQWLLALIALVVVVSLNLISVKVFGEMEFWFALIKVTALIVFLVVGIVILAFGWPTSHGPTGIAMLAAHGGFLPDGVSNIALALVLIQGVVFAYAGVELVGTAAGETAEPKKIMPRAVNSVIWRIAIFYCGSVLLLSLLLPSGKDGAYKAGVSPFVTLFGSLGNPELGAIVGTIMNFVVLTAALSSLNAGMYSTGRILRSMAQSGGAPKFTNRISKAGVPYGGILLTAAVGIIGVGINYLWPSEAFSIVLNVASLGIISTWAIIILCQMRLRKWAMEGKLERPSFRLFGAPFTSYLTLVFLVGVLVLMTFDMSGGGFWTIVVILPLTAIALVIGWYAQRGRIMRIAQERAGFTGAFPVVASRPGIDAINNKKDGEEK